MTPKTDKSGVPKPITEKAAETPLPDVWNPIAMHPAAGPL